MSEASIDFHMQRQEVTVHAHHFSRNYNFINKILNSTTTACKRSRRIKIILVKKKIKVSTHFFIDQEKNKHIIIMQHNKKYQLVLRYTYNNIYLYNIVVCMLCATIYTKTQSFWIYYVPLFFRTFSLKPYKNFYHIL